MGLLYDVTYPNDPKSFDTDVPDRYLDHLQRQAATDESLLGARARCTNGGGRLTLVLCQGACGPEWKEATRAEG